MGYATVADVLARYDQDLVAQLTGDPKGQAVDETMLGVHLGDADSEIDDFLATRFELPLTDVPPSLVSIACDIAIFRLQGLRPRGDVKESRERYEAALKRLAKVADRRAALAGAPTTSNSVQVQRGRTVFNRPEMTRFRGLLANDHIYGHMPGDE
jgi:phage gp36-like protein